MSSSPKLTPIVVSHVVTSELATLTINDPSDSVMTSQPVTLYDAPSDVTHLSAGPEDVTSPLDGAVNDVTNTNTDEEKIEIV